MRVSAAEHMVSPHSHDMNASANHDAPHVCQCCACLLSLMICDAPTLRQVRTIEAAKERLKKELEQAGKDRIRNMSRSPSAPSVAEQAAAPSAPDAMQA